MSELDTGTPTFGGARMRPEPRKPTGKLARFFTSRRTRRAAFGLVLLVMMGLGAIYGSWTRACAGTACPSIAVLESYRPTQTAKVYAADGRLFTELGIERRTVLAFEDIPPSVRAAFVAVEDHHFYKHGGVDYRRILGAIKSNILALGFAEGFSTITMQLARNVFPDKLPSAKDVRRKVREMRVALEIEETYSKDKILELYLNQIYLGGSAYGVESGAHRYFGKSATELNLAEAALLAAIANLPGRYDPRRNPERALQRRNLVINRMRDEGYISAHDAEGWKAYPVVLSSREGFDDVAPYFRDWVLQQLFDRFGMAVYERGFRVYTTIDLDMQIAAERALEEQLERMENGEFSPYNHVTYAEDLENGRESGVERSQTPYIQGALITLEAKTGYVRAMVGGRDFTDSKFNRATQARRQAGSTFKPFVYTAAIRANYPLSYIIDDAPISRRLEGDSLPWEPQNFEMDFRGPMTLRDGLRLSRNLVAVRLGEEVGERAVIGEARRFGLSTRLPLVPSIFIGAADVIPLEMASAYTAFATVGTRAAPVGILRVEDEFGNIVWEPQTRTERILDEEHMWLMTDALNDVVRRGTARYRVVDLGGFRHPAGGKTGTTNDGADVWFVGFTSELVTAVWMGFDAPRKIMTLSSGGRLAAPAWATYMNEVYERRPPPAGWQRPESLILLRIDHHTGYLATGWCPQESTSHEWFIPGTEPVEFCPVHNPFITGVSRVPERE
ncbi:MAG: PBP1A family penicillin-binding protein [Gemmatimonadales bacterium]|jgi:penicillin-binding protein 1A